jgi:hypothetical protein
MRYSVLLLCAAVPLSSGCCSALIAESGKDLGGLSTRDLVRQEFGEPQTSGMTDGQAFDDYRTHRMTYNLHPGHSMTIGMTFGLAEFVLLPCELYHLGRVTIWGEHLRFTYDAHGTVTGVFVDGQRSFWFPKRNMPAPEPTGPPQPTSVEVRPMAPPGRVLREEALQDQRGVGPCSELAPPRR